MARLGGDRNGNGNGGFGNQGKGPGGGALSGPPYHKGPRYDPHGSGPQTPRDSQKKESQLEHDDWDEPCGAPSETPRPRG